VEPFIPLKPPKVAMYVCGPTVYDIPHIGHARSAYVFDILRRYLAFKGYEVRFVRNITDVDDKIIEKARQETGDRRQDAGHRTQDAGDLKAKCREVAERYLKSYHEAMDRLGISRPNVEPKATDHVVPNMTDFISKLLMSGAAYEAGGPACRATDCKAAHGAGRDVYFAVRKCEGYGRLSNRTLDELQAGARVEPGEHKQDPLDFALWKAAKPEEPSWPSPWGAGRPGWHIECSVMSTKELGDAFDIHGGGVDLVFPHHENEIAQARGAGKSFARTWIHNGLLTVSGEKMSKSLGNYITVEDTLKTYAHPDYLKLFFLKTHYRSPIDHTPQRMDEAKANWQEFSRFFQHYDQFAAQDLAGGKLLGSVQEGLARFTAAMDDDLNTPRALSVLFDFVNMGHAVLNSGGPEKIATARGIRDALLECGTTLGLFLGGMSEESPMVARRIQERIAERDAARRAKDFARADQIRQELRAEGVFLTDAANGTVWHRAQ